MFSLLNILSKIFLALIFVITTHELGHLFVAEYLDFPVESFNIGIGPTFFSFNFQNLLINLRIIPLGGFVALQDNFDLYSNSSFFDICFFSLIGVLINLFTFFIFSNSYSLSYKVLLFLDIISFNLKENFFNSFKNFIIYFSALLFFINILPFVPLDGSKIILWLLHNLNYSNILPFYSNVSFLFFIFIIFYFNCSDSLRDKINCLFFNIKYKIFFNNLSPFKYCYLHLNTYSELWKFYNYNYPILIKNTTKLVNFKKSERNSLKFLLFERNYSRQLIIMEKVVEILKNYKS